ncbi:MAG TPA: PilZ domain-containing protein [Tepidisphaeraceae bacterium]|nr:PilZ domain-containing protein [Tepidisphaeraceae bacterium]
MSSSHDLQSESNKAAAERRRRERVAGETQGWILSAMPQLPAHLPDGDDEAWEVRIHNVSRIGVGFASTAAMRIGDEHRIRIGRGPMKRARLIRVVACRQGDDGTYTVGAEFVDHPSKTLARAS